MGHDEQREHNQTPPQYELALMIGDDYYSCQVNNISEMGASLTLTNCDQLSLKTDDEGSCLISYKNADFESKFRVISVSDNNIDIIFWGMDVNQHFFLTRLIAET